MDIIDQLIALLPAQYRIWVILVVIGYIVIVKVRSRSKSQILNLIENSINSQISAIQTITPITPNTSINMPVSSVKSIIMPSKLYKIINILF